MLSVIIFNGHQLSPYVSRIRMHWADMRGVILKTFPQTPRPNQNPDEYLKHMDDIYLTDAYHSLSIEGYRISEGLIEQIRSGAWDPRWCGMIIPYGTENYLPRVSAPVL
jgi:hypothetical protein